MVCTHINWCAHHIKPIRTYMETEITKVLEEENLINTAITEHEIQSYAENNFGRELTDVELNRIARCWYEIEGAYAAQIDLIREAIVGAMNNEGGSWNKIDKDYLESLKK